MHLKPNRLALRETTTITERNAVKPREKLAHRKCEQVFDRKDEG